MRNDIKKNQFLNRKLLQINIFWELLLSTLLTENFHCNLLERRREFYKELSMNEHRMYQKLAKH